MRISGMNNGTMPRPGQAGLQQADSVSKNIQKKIADKQKELQNLSSNQELDMETKRKKRQEIMQEIHDLQNQLKQHQAEQRREAASGAKNQEKGTSMEDMLGRNRRTSAGKGKQSELAQAGMETMISADAALNLAQAQGSAAKEMENRAAILKTEIRQDAGRGDVTAKKKELAELEQRAEHAASAQMDTLGEADRAIRNAQASGETAEKPEDKKAEEEETKRTDGQKKEEQKKEEQKKTSIDIYL